MKIRTTLAIAAALLFSAAVRADEASAPKAFSPDDCARHCRDMAAQKQKMTDDHRKTADEMQAAWRDIEAELDIARKAKGDKKADALIIALDRLIATHQMMSDRMTPAPGGMMGMGPDCCAGMHDMPGMAMDCCAKMPAATAAMEMNCCAGKHEKAAMGKDCPMMNGTAARAESK